MSERKPKSRNATKRTFLKGLVVLVVFSLAITILLLLYDVVPQPTEFSPDTNYKLLQPDPNYELPEEANFLLPEQKRLLFDVLSRIHPVRYDPNDQKVCEIGRTFAKKAWTAQIRWLRKRKERDLKECINNALAAINNNYHMRDNSPLDILSEIIHFQNTDRAINLKEYGELVSVTGFFSYATKDLHDAQDARKEASHCLATYLIYAKAAPLADKYKAVPESFLHCYNEAFNSYLGCLKKALTYTCRGTIKEGSYENTVKTIDGIFAGLDFIPEKIHYRPLGMPEEESVILTLRMPNKELLSDDERQQNINHALEGIRHDTTQLQRKIDAYRDLANMMGSSNFMTDDHLLNQIMIFSIGKYIFQKATEREASIWGKDSEIYRRLLKETDDSGTVASHYIFLYNYINKEEKELLDFLWRK